jgi:phthalate 4,5-dioxygenase
MKTAIGNSWRFMTSPSQAKRLADFGTLPGILPSLATDKTPRLQFARTSFGFHYAPIRRPIVNAGTHDYVRTTA